MSRDVDAAIIAGGGRIVYSTTVDTSELPRSPHATTRSRCGICGEPGHIARRCNGPGLPPRPLAATSQRRRAAGVGPEERPCQKCGELGHDARRHNGRHNAQAPRTEPEQ